MQDKLNSLRGLMMWEQYNQVKVDIKQLQDLCMDILKTEGNQWQKVVKNEFVFQAIMGSISSFLVHSLIPHEDLIEILEKNYSPLQVAIKEGITFGKNNDPKLPSHFSSIYFQFSEMLNKFSEIFLKNMEKSEVESAKKPSQPEAKPPSAAPRKGLWG
jgi:hypothetical protein